MAQEQQAIHGLQSGLLASSRRILKFRAPMGITDRCDQPGLNSSLTKSTHDLLEREGKAELGRIQSCSASFFNFTLLTTAVPRTFVAFWRRG